jgi:hypothetical protein
MSTGTQMLMMVKIRADLHDHRDLRSFCVFALIAAPLREIMDTYSSLKTPESY